MNPGVAVVLDPGRRRRRMARERRNRHHRRHQHDGPQPGSPALETWMYSSREPRAEWADVGKGLLLGPRMHCGGEQAEQFWPWIRTSGGRGVRCANGCGGCICLVLECKFLFKPLFDVPCTDSELAP
jgi:hypothetical protein